MKKKFIIFAFLGVIILLFTGCSKNIGGTELEGINVIWTPVIAIWQWLWKSFTPGFWAFVKLVWKLPTAVSWIAGIIVYLLGVILYIAIVIIIILFDLLIGFLIGIIWFLLAILNGIFHFI